MAYATSNPPRMVLDLGLGSYPKLWVYASADAAATVDASGYFTDGYDRGMRDGDLIFVYATGSKIWSAHTVTVSGTTVNLADGTTIGSSTNSD
ncbi:MAG: hypothetical protein KIT36_16225 [Alphaproteobacteria bacterium]|nr:hypothetical protein [Alphaproteobacteria bacterium]